MTNEFISSGSEFHSYYSNNWQEVKEMDDGIGYTTCDTKTVPNTSYSYRTVVKFKVPQNNNDILFDNKEITVIDTIKLQIGVVCLSKTKIRGYLCIEQPDVKSKGDNIKNPPEYITYADSEEFSTDSSGKRVELNFTIPKKYAIKSDSFFWVWFSTTTDIRAEIYSKRSDYVGDALLPVLNTTRYTPARLYTKLQSKWREIFYYGYVNERWERLTPWIYVELNTLKSDKENWENWEKRINVDSKEKEDLNGISLVKENGNVIGVWIKSPIKRLLT